MSEKPYDSTEDTYKHKNRVGELMSQAATRLMMRADQHDNSKLEPPEKPLFDQFTHRLKGMKYGSDEYKETLALLKPALDHHYACNAHHPESRAEGVKAMSLLDLLEMLADWKAAGERHQRADCNLTNSLKVNRTRFHIPNQIFRQLISTSLELGWITPEDALFLVPDELRGVSLGEEGASAT